MLASRLALCITLAMTAVTPASATTVKDKDRIRAQAEHDCADDAQRLCPDAVPDEDKVVACFKAKRARLSPACGKTFTEGLKMK